MLAVFLPVFLLFLALTSDVGKVYYSRERYQNILDEAVMLGLRYLPNSSVIENRVRNFINTKDSELANLVNTELLDSGILNLTAKVTPNSLLGNFFGLQNVFTFWVQSKAQVVPRDVAVFLDTSDILAPLTLENGTDAWGGVDWPIARYLNNKLISEDEKKLATQRCFNPVLSAFKEASIRVVDYFSSFPQNNVGVLVAPGYKSNVYEISVLKNLDNSPVTNTANFGFYRDEPMSDELCLAIIDDERNVSGYKVPKPIDEFGIGSEYTWVGKITREVEGVPKIKRNKVHELNVRDVIWSRSVRKQDDKSFPLDLVLKETSNMLFSGTYRQGQGDVNNLLNSLGIIFMSDYPWHETQTNVRINLIKRRIRRALRNIDLEAQNYNKNLQIYFIGTKHIGSYGSSCINNLDWGVLNPCENFIRDSLSFRDFLSDLESELENTKLIHFRAPDTATIGQELLAILPLIGQRYAKIN